MHKINGVARNCSQATKSADCNSFSQLYVQQFSGEVNYLSFIFEMLKAFANQESLDNLLFSLFLQSLIRLQVVVVTQERYRFAAKLV